MSDAAAASSYRHAIDRAGFFVTFRRVNGNAPRTANFDARVKVVAPQPFSSGAALGGFAGENAIRQNDRQLIVMTEDLRAKHFPLPLKRNDKVEINGQWLNIRTVDAIRRQFGDAIEVVAEGV